MDPVFPPERNRSHRVLRQIGAQLDFGIFEKPGELMPQRKRAGDRLSRCAGRQRGKLRRLHFRFDGFGQRTRPLLSQNIALRMIHARLASLGIDLKKVVDPLHQLPRNLVARTQLHGVEDFSPRMCPASRMHHSRTADAFVCDVTVGLQDARKPTEEFLRAFAPAPHSEPEQNSPFRGTILPKISLMNFPPLVVHLHGHRRLVGLNITAAGQFFPDRGGSRHE
jgi:hypothetical protein